MEIGKLCIKEGKENIELSKNLKMRGGVGVVELLFMSGMCGNPTINNVFAVSRYLGRSLIMIPMYLVHFIAAKILNCFFRDIVVEF